MLDAVITSLVQLNNNKVFWGLTLILMNLGSRYVIADLNKLYENVLMMDLIKKLVLFCMFFVGCRDVLTSLALTFAFSIVFQALLNAHSKYNLLPKSALNFVLSSMQKPVSEDEYKNAKQIVERYESSALSVVPINKQLTRDTISVIETYKKNIALL